MKIKIHPELSDKIVLGYLLFDRLENQADNPRLWEEIEQVSESYRNRFHSPSEALELLKPARRLYHTFGMEPTRYRPSSEALLRRVLKNKPLYRVNSIVDTANYCSLAFLLPIGLYDVDKLQGDIEARIGKEGEQYDGIRKDVIHVSGKLILADRQGAFGNPTSDSLRTCIELTTRRVLMVLFAPAGYQREKMQERLDFAAEKMLRFHPTGQLVEKNMLP